MILENQQNFTGPVVFIREENKKGPIYLHIRMGKHSILSTEGISFVNLKLFTNSFSKHDGFRQRKELQMIETKGNTQKGLS